MRLNHSKLIWFSTLVSLILLANFSLYRVDFTKPITPLITIGSFLDFIVTIPLLAYFLVIRKRHSIKYLFTVIAMGYGAAWLIIPSQHFKTISFAKYFIFSIEGIFVLIEVSLMILLIRKLPKLLSNFKKTKQYPPYFNNQLESAFASQFKPSRFIHILVTEISLIYFSLFTWRKKNLLSNFEAFTYHKKTSSIAFNVMLIHALIIESIGFHFLLHKLSPTVSIIALVLNFYTLLMLVAEIQAIRLCPYLLSNRQLYLQSGLMKKIDIPLENIQSFHTYIGPEKLSKLDSKTLFDATLSDFMKDKPNYEILLKVPITATFIYGFSKKVTRIHLNVDQPNEFSSSLLQKLDNLRK